MLYAGILQHIPVLSKKCLAYPPKLLNVLVLGTKSSLGSCRHHTSANPRAAWLSRTSAGMGIDPCVFKISLDKGESMLFVLHCM